MEAVIQNRYHIDWYTLLSYPLTKVYQDYQWAEYFEALETWKAMMMSASRI